MKNLKVARIKKRYTQQDLANALNVSRSCISMWETGESQPDTKTLVMIADILEVTTDYLLGRKESVSHVSLPQGYEQLSPECKKQIDSLIFMLLDK